ncbi:MAG: hypothetical protein V9G98_10275 [Candidatus Competibacter sp.]
MGEAKRLPVNERRLDELGLALRAKLDRQIGLRRLTEERWISDLRQYHGRYAGEFEEILRRQESETGASAIFVNITRTKCDAAEARVADMLFPTDDRNWTIGPTPDPELAQRADSRDAMTLQDGMVFEVDGMPATVGEVANAEMERAKAAAAAMQREIDDQLTEARYPALARDVIQDAVRLGTGIIKGPIVIGRAQKTWQHVDGSVYEVRFDRRRRPGLRRVSPWDFYPDMSAPTLADAEFFFERQRLRRKQVRRLADAGQGYIRSRIKRVLEDDTCRARRWNEDDYRARLREIADVYAVEHDGSSYDAWIYTGPLDAAIAEAAGLPKPGTFDEKEIEVHFIGDKVIKIVELPLETDEHCYSAFNWIKADGSIFGYGVPFILRASQEIAGKSWRGIVDNAGLSVGPQIVVDQRMIEPADGVWQLTPRKVWWKKDPSQNIGNAFATFNIDSRQPELKDIFLTARELADEETALPRLQQGEIGNMPVQTATGMSMLLNASNAFLRRIIKNWDDDVTVPLITGFYDYNMQYNPDPSIKGDFKVDARGSSALMVKETQTQALLSLLQFAVNPAFAPLFRPAALLRKAIEAQRLNPDDILYTEDEIKRRESEPKPPDIEAQRLAFEQQNAQEQRDFKMLELSLKENLSARQLQAKLREIELKEQGESERQDREMALKLTVGSGI